MERPQTSTQAGGLACLLRLLLSTHILPILISGTVTDKVHSVCRIAGEALIATKSVDPTQDRCSNGPSIEPSPHRLTFDSSNA